MRNKFFASALLGAALATTIFVGDQQINAATTTTVSTTNTTKKRTVKAPKLVINKQIKGSYTLTGKVTKGANLRFYVVNDNSNKVTKSNATLVGRILNIKTNKFSQKFFSQNAGKTILVSAAKNGVRTRQLVVLAGPATTKKTTTTTSTKPVLKLNTIKAGSTTITGTATPKATVRFYTGKDLITKKIAKADGSFSEKLYSSMLGKKVTIKVTYNKKQVTKSITLKKAKATSTN